MDYYTFLLNCFVNDKFNNEDIFNSLKTLKITSWIALSGILKALLWNGIKSYVETNIKVFDTIYEKFGNSWFAALNFDFSGITDGRPHILCLPQEIQPDIKSLVIEQNNKLSNKLDVFKYCKNWFESILIPKQEPKTEIEWDSFSEILFWMSEINIKKEINLSNFNFLEATNTLSLEVLSNILLGLKLFNKDTDNNYSDIDNIFLERIRLEYSIPKIEFSEDSIFTEFLIDIFKDTKDLNIHERAVTINTLLRKAFPFKQFYKTQGYGQKLGFTPDYWDESTLNVNRQYIPYKQLPRINRFIINLVDYRKRPKNWENYIQQIIDYRKTAVKTLNYFVEKLKKFYHYKKDFIISEYERKNLNNQITSMKLPKLPVNVVDRWGFISEDNAGVLTDKKEVPEELSNLIKNVGSKKTENSSISERNQANEIIYFSLQKYKSYLKTFEEHNRQIENFVNNGSKFTLKKQSKSWEEAGFSGRVTSSNIFDLIDNLEEFHKNFRIHFFKYVDSTELTKLETEEKGAINTLNFLWNYYINRGN